MENDSGERTGLDWNADDAAVRELGWYRRNLGFSSNTPELKVSFRSDWLYLLLEASSDIVKEMME